MKNVLLRSNARESILIAQWGERWISKRDIVCLIPERGEFSDAKRSFMCVTTKFVRLLVKGVKRCQWQLKVGNQKASASLESEVMRTVRNKICRLFIPFPYVFSYFVYPKLWPVMFYILMTYCWHSHHLFAIHCYKYQ